MTYNEESYLLDTIEDIRKNIGSHNFNQFVREVHENNIMLKQIIKVINTYVANHNSENNDDFVRNILANLISNKIDVFNVK